MKYLYFLISTALLVAASISEAAITTTGINPLSRNKTADLTYNETLADGSTGSVTLRIVMEPTRNGVPINANFSSLNIDARVGLPDGGDGGAFTSNHGNGFKMTVSLVDYSTNVNPSSIQFKLDALGVRAVTTKADYSWTSSASPTATTGTVSPQHSDVQRPLDTGTYGDLENTPYTGFFSMPTSNERLVLSDAGFNGARANHHGLTTSTTFTAATPEPSSAALLGLGGLVMIFVRRK